MRGRRAGGKDSNPDLDMPDLTCEGEEGQSRRGRLWQFRY